MFGRVVLGCGIQQLKTDIFYFRRITVALMLAHNKHVSCICRDVRVAPCSTTHATRHVTTSSVPECMGGSVTITIETSTDGATTLSRMDLSGCLQDNSPTNQLAVSQVADWITRGLVNSPTANFKKSWNYYTLFVH